jgi:uncharacterized SAM-binding protein YcdF (DUF218 family)
MEKRLRLATTLLLLFFCFLVVFRILGDVLYRYESLSTVEAATKPALIVVLAGGKGRIEAAFQLFSLGNSTSLFVAGAGPHTTLSTLVKANLNNAEAISLSKRMSSITVETESRNTIENAYAVAGYLSRNPAFNEIILITSSYHMRRSMLIFKHLLNTQIKISAYNPPNAPISRNDWFYTLNGAEITAVELFKLAFARLIIPQLANF